MTSSIVAIVTGGAQGIGAAICIELLKKGYRVCIADLQESKSEEFAKEQQSTFGEESVIAIQCDVSKKSDFKDVFEKTIKKFKRVDVLINNAGVMLEHNPRKCLEVNLLGTLLGCHIALKHMGKSKGGNGGFVINISSASALTRVPEVPAYVASKSGVIALTRCFGLPYHYDKDGIMFAALCPYTVDTSLLKTAETLDPTQDFSKRTDKMSPEFAAKGVLKILDDKINGSVLVALQDGYHYIEYQDELKNLMSKNK